MSENPTLSPRRLVFMKFVDICMYCENPKGESYIRYVYLEDKFGYISCENCKHRLADSVKIWENDLAYDKANHLKNKKIKIQRSSGIIENGWELSCPITRTDEDNFSLIQCFNEEHKIYKWCKLDDILKLN